VFEVGRFAAAICKNDVIPMASHPTAIELVSHRLLDTAEFGLSGAPGLGRGHASSDPVRPRSYPRTPSHSSTRFQLKAGQAFA